MGRLLNLAGAPGFVRDCDYDASACQATVSVKTGQLFTVVRVNGMDVYFNRLTGTIDGIGFNPAFDCTLIRAEGSEHSDERAADVRAKVRTGIPAVRS